MSNSSRRQVLKCFSAAMAGAALGRLPLPGSTGGSWAADRSTTPPQPHLKFPTAPRERLAVSSWPFRDFIEAPTNRWARKPQKPGIDLKDFPAMVVRRFNVRNIEPLNDHFRSTDAKYVQEFRETVEKAGARVVNIPVGGRNSYYDPDPEKRNVAVTFGKKWVDIAVALGSPSIRTHIAGARGTKPDVDRTAESLSRLADYGAEKNVIITLENDDLKTEDAFFLVRVIAKANHRWLYALPDFCNSMTSGNADFNYKAMKALFKDAYNIAHMKDSEVGDDGKLYTVDVGRTFGIARDAGYRGYFSMEWEGKGEPYAGTQRLIDESLKYLT